MDDGFLDADTKEPGERTIRCANSACQRVIYPGRYRQRRYCSEACKQAAYRSRRKKEEKRVTPP